MRRFFLLLAVMLCVAPHMLSSSKEAKNGINLGKGRFTVMMHVFGQSNGNGSCEIIDVEEFMKGIEIYVATKSLFDNFGNESRTPMQRIGSIYNVEVPLECIEEVCGIRVFMNSELVGGGQVILNQNSASGIRLFMTTDGRIFDIKYLEGPTLSDWMTLANITQEALLAEPYVFVPEDKSLYKSWMAVRDDEMKSLWPRFYAKCTSQHQIPADMSGWVDNNLKSYFASQCVLPYAINAKEYCGVTVDEPPMGAYSFLDSIDYSADVFLLSDMMLSSRRKLLEGILVYPCGGLEKIGETTVAEWQKTIGDKLSPAIKDCPKLLLDLLAGMSYVRQIDNNEPLTETQKKNIAAGFTDDIGKIVLARNERLSGKKSE